MILKNIFIYVHQKRIHVGIMGEYLLNETFFFNNNNSIIPLAI